MSYLNYIRNKIFFNGLTDEDKTNYVGSSYDVTTDLKSIKQYLGIDSSIQRQVFSDYTDLTDYYLIIDDSQFIKDQTCIEITDIYFTDSSNIRYDNSILLFTRDELIQGYNKQYTDYILHFVIQINKFADITDNMVYSMPLFLQPNMDQIANDLILQYDIHFVSINFFNEFSLTMALKDYIRDEYSTKLNNRMKLSFLGWNNIDFIDYKAMLRSKILSLITTSLEVAQNTKTGDEIKYYQHTYDDLHIIKGETDIDTVLNLFYQYAMDFYENHTDYTVDLFAGFTTDPDLYMAYQQLERFKDRDQYHFDVLKINFGRFLLIRNNIYRQKFTLKRDNSIFWSDYIQFKVQNIIPNQTHDFTLIEQEFDMTVVTNHETDIPLKIDILEFSNNLVQNNNIAYSRQINEYYYDGFRLQFMINRLNVDYGFNSLRIFLSDSLSESYKDIKYQFVYAPQDVISQRIAHVKFDVLYSSIQNGWDINKLLPLKEDYTDYNDLSAVLSPDSTDMFMRLQIPINYELIYSKPVKITAEFDVTDSNGELMPHFNYLIQDNTSAELSIEPTLTVEQQGTFGKKFMLMFRYKFDPGLIYTDEIMQKLNGMIKIRIYTSSLDTTDDNYFEKYGTVPFVTIRFKLRKKSYQPPSAASYAEDRVVKFVPPLSKVNTLKIKSCPSVGMGNVNSDSDKPITTVNRSITVKNIPITSEVVTGFGCDSKEGSYNKDTTSDTPWKSCPVIGNIKEAENFILSEIYTFMLNNFLNWTVHDLFNWYMSSLNNDIQINYTVDYTQTMLSTNKTEFMQWAMSTNDPTEINSYTTIKSDFQYNGQDHTSDQKYNPTNVAEHENDALDWENEMGVTWHQYQNAHATVKTRFNIKFAQSNVYYMDNVMAIFNEAFINKYHPDLLPKGYKKTTYDNVGVIYDEQFYRYGYYFREGFFRGKYQLIDKKLPLYGFNQANGLIGGFSGLTSYFMNNNNIPVTIDGTVMSLTCNQIIDLYISDTTDRKGIKSAVHGLLSKTLGSSFSGMTLYVKRVYSADLTCELDTLTEDMFSISLFPTSISPLYSKFKITEFKYAYATSVAKITKLFDEDDLASQQMKISDIFGTGIKLSHKYTNYSLAAVPISIMIIYKDEYGYEKTTSIDIKVPPRLRVMEESTLSRLIDDGVNQAKALQFIMLFNEANSHVKNMEAAVAAATGAHLNSGDSDALRADAKAFWAGFFGLEKEFKKTQEKYLPEKALNCYKSIYIKAKQYQKPTFTFKSNVIMMVMPENANLINTHDPTQTFQTEKMIKLLFDGSYSYDKTFNEFDMESVKYLVSKGLSVPVSLGSQEKADAGGGGDRDKGIRYDKVVKEYYDEYISKMGYDVNLILQPDMTYYLALKSFINFSFIYEASGEKPVADLEAFRDCLGGLSKLHEIVGLAKVYPNIRDIISACFRDFYIKYNFQSYGRVPNAQHPIEILEYYPDQFQADYNMLIHSMNMYEYTGEAGAPFLRLYFGMAIPYEKIIISVDTTSTGIFDINFIEYSHDTTFIFDYEKQKTEFQTDEIDSGAMMKNMTEILRTPLKVKIRVDVPDVIPEKYITVVVKSLFNVY